MERALGIDVGGTKLAAGVVAADGTLLSFVTGPTQPNDEAEGLFQTLVALGRRAIAAAGLEPGDLHAIGVGSGGPMRWPEGVVSPLNIPGWRAFPLRDRLRAEFGRAVVVDNDAKALAVGERWLGRGRGARSFLAMVVSTGVGGGLVVDGRLVHGATGNAGHIGHVLVWPEDERDPGEPRCGCGAIGCLEAVASITGLRRRLGRALARGERTTLGPTVSGEELARAARAGDRLAQQLFADAGRALGRGIASAAALLDLDVVAVGGGIARAGDLLWEPLHAELARSARIEFLRDLRVEPVALGERGGVIGAAALVLPKTGCVI